jgi:hypothetical protein
MRLAAVLVLITGALALGADRCVLLEFFTWNA